MNGNDWLELEEQGAFEDSEFLQWLNEKMENTKDKINEK